MRHGVSHVLIAVLLVAFLLPPFYVVSAGPAIWCRDRRIIQQRTLMAIYGPLDYAYRIPVLGSACHWYWSKWHRPELRQQQPASL